jgi:hypothetical protein
MVPLMLFKPRCGKGEPEDFFVLAKIKDAVHLNFPVGDQESNRNGRSEKASRLPRFEICTKPNQALWTGHFLPHTYAAN